MKPKLDISREKLCDFYTNKRLSSTKIGKIFSCNFATILNRLRGFGIPIRGTSDVRKLNIEEKQLQILYTNKKLSSVEIGKMFNCNSTTICSRLRKFGIPIRPHKPEINRAELHNLYITKQMSSVEIGRMFNCSCSTVCERLREFGIPVRSKEELIKACLRRRIPSSLEEQFQKIIDKYDLPYSYVGNGAFILGSYNPDFININSEKIAIEVFARYYKKRNKISIEEWKEKREQVFKSYGWKLFFFNEIEVNEKNVLKILRPEEVSGEKNED